MLSTRRIDSSSASNGADRSSGISGFATPSASYDRSRESIHSIVDQHLTMRGDLESDGDVLVKGKVIGNIKCKLLIVDADASIEGGVDVEEVIIRGKAKGKIQADRVKLEKTAIVDCEIEHRSFSVEEGARLKGTLRLKGEAEDSDRDVVALVA